MLHPRTRDVLLPTEEGSPRGAFGGFVKCWGRSILHDSRRIWTASLREIGCTSINFDVRWEDNGIDALSRNGRKVKNIKHLATDCRGPFYSKILPPAPICHHLPPSATIWRSLDLASAAIYILK